MVNMTHGLTCTGLLYDTATECSTNVQILSLCDATCYLVAEIKGCVCKYIRILFFLYVTSYFHYFIYWHFGKYWLFLGFFLHALSVMRDKLGSHFYNFLFKINFLSLITIIVLRHKTTRTLYGPFSKLTRRLINDFFRRI